MSYFSHVVSVATDAVVVVAVDDVVAAVLVVVTAAVMPGCLCLSVAVAVAEAGLAAMTVGVVFAWLL